MDETESRKLPYTAAQEKFEEQVFELLDFFEVDNVWNALLKARALKSQMEELKEEMAELKVLTKTNSFRSTRKRILELISFETKEFKKLHKQQISEINNARKKAKTFGHFL